VPRGESYNPAAYKGTDSSELEESGVIGNLLMMAQREWRRCAKPNDVRPPLSLVSHVTSRGPVRVGKQQLSRCPIGSFQVGSEVS
jgi:hypothetical protein